ncbi:helix-turn-helix domain-containing protein [Anaerosalibacter sp. Marseille-P3206]|uniref:helix-turn-helix domain-containing protein n=1 Tax=Anaerosalibacter sp. Marseille-P3206 TaxID=1871005 RepID=UPI001177D254|nr:helix-turn-helix domain-containing protein [Anaerosalibacter sp. Marseille-P3206]
MNIKEVAEKELKEMGYGKNEKALFYLGCMVRKVDKKQCALKGHSSFANRIFNKYEFEANIKRLYTGTIEKVVEYNIESEVEWAMKGFVENYTEEIEKMKNEEKQFYLISGSAFAGVAQVDEVMTFKEASEKWNVSTSNLRNNVRNGRFEDDEVRKSGEVWLVAESAMKRLYGKKEEE